VFNFIINCIVDPSISGYIDPSKQHILYMCMFKFLNCITNTVRVKTKCRQADNLLKLLVGPLPSKTPTLYIKTIEQKSLSI